jgi:hypothetical protein
MVKTARLMLLAAVAAVAVASPASAGPAKTIRLAWSERAVEGGKTVMTFQVRTLKVEGRRWTIAASFRNTSRVKLGIRRQFALLYGPGRERVSGLKVLTAKSFRPAMPTALAPGKSWRGSFSGTGGTALTKTYIRVQFSYFRGKVIAGRPGFGWITDHVARIN